MKKIHILPLLIIVLSVISVLGNSIPALSNSGSSSILKQILPDSLCILLKNRPIIFYSSGHYGYSWSLIARNDSTYQVYSGRVDYSGDCFLNEISGSAHFDTTILFIHNEAILSWGFDSISVEVANMRKVDRTPFVTIWTDLSVFDSNGENIFSSDNAISFAGSDSVAFNKKYQKLSLIMRWISDPRIREYIPDSVIY